MSAEEKKERNGVSLTLSHWKFLRANGDASTKLRAILDKVLSGEWVDAAATTSKDANCIFNMRTLEENSSMVCPIKLNWPDLKEEKKRGDLLTCCRICPRKKEYDLLLKMRVKYPTAFKETEAADTDQQQQTRQLQKYQMCKNGCGTEIYFEYSKNKQKWLPTERISGLLHVCPNWKGNYQPATTAPTPITAPKPALKDFSVKCSMCDFVIHSKNFKHEQDPYGTMDDFMLGHKRKAHNSAWIEPEEHAENAAKGGCKLEQ